jgi:hypothetical protein
LFCTGHDTKKPELVVLKARVNRGYGYHVSTGAPTDWRYNSTEASPGEFETLRRAVAEVDTTNAALVGQLFAGGDLVGPGEEFSAGMTNSAAASLPAGQPALTLSPASAYVFLATLTAKLVLDNVLDQAQGIVAMGVALVGLTTLAPP